MNRECALRCWWRRNQRHDLRLLAHVKPGDGPTDDHALDLRRALENRENLRVPVHALDWVIPGVTISAQDLDRLLGDPHRRLPGHQLRYRALATPTAIAATVGLEASKVFIAACSPLAWPAASLASLASSLCLPPTRQWPGTRTSSSTTSAVCEALTPCLRNFCPWERPLVPGGTMKLA